MKFLYLPLCAVTFCALGCNDTPLDVWQGTTHIQCDVEMRTDAYVENQTDQVLDFGFCSRNYDVQASKGHLAKDEGHSFSTGVSKENRKFQVPRGDGCEEADTIENVEAQVPVLSAADAAAFKICTRFQFVFIILPKNEPCPEQSQTIESAGLKCG